MDTNELTEREAAEYLGISRKWLAEMRRTGRGPMFLDYGYRTKRYLRRHLKEWKKRRRQTALRRRVVREETIED